MPIEYWNADIQEYQTRPLILQITRMISASMLFLIEFIREILIGGIKTVVAVRQTILLGNNFLFPQGQQA